MNTKPKVKNGIDWINLKLTEEEAFILSRIDGNLNLEEIALCVGKEKEEIEKFLNKFESLGLIEWEKISNDSYKIKPLPEEMKITIPEKVSEKRSLDKNVDQSELVTPKVQQPFKENEKILEDYIKEIDIYYLKLNLANYYELLGVGFNATTKEIRTAYFSLSKRFHPDSDFGKKVVGEYKKKLEKIFSKLTDAYTILSNKKKREEYDNYLKLVEKIDIEEKKLKELKEPTPKSRVEGVQEPIISQKIKELANVATSNPSSIPRPPSNPVLEKVKEWKRENLLLKTMALQKKDKSLKQKEIEANRATKKVAEEYAEAGRRALEAKDFVSAANAFKLAMELDPENSGYKVAYESAEREAKQYLGNYYFNRGKYELDIGNFEQALLSFKRAVELMPEQPQYNYYMAKAIFLSDGNLYEAKKYLTKAIELKPNTSQFHALLARVYFKANLYRNAKREIEIAMSLEPYNEEYKELLLQIKKMI